MHRRQAAQSNQTKVYGLTLTLSHTGGRRYTALRDSRQGGTKDRRVRGRQWWHRPCAPRPVMAAAGGLRARARALSLYTREREREREREKAVMHTPRRVMATAGDSSTQLNHAFPLSLTLFPSFSLPFSLSLPSLSLSDSLFLCIHCTERTHAIHQHCTKHARVGDCSTQVM